MSRSYDTQGGANYYNSIWEPRAVNAGPILGDTLIFAHTNDLPRTLGGEGLWVRPGETFSENGREFTLNPADAESWSALQKALKARKFVPQTVIFDWARDPFEINNLTRAMHHGVDAMYHFTRALMKLRPKKPVAVLFLFKNFGQGAPQYAGCAGVARTVRKEAPKFLFKTIEFVGDLPPHEQLADVIRAEAADIEGIEIAYRDGVRYSRRLKGFRTFADAPPMPLTKGGAVIITGGLGGLGLIFAEFLAREGANLVLTGRSPMNDNRRDQLQQLERTFGCRALYVSGDIADRDDVNTMVQQARHEFGSISGVVHSAGVNRDSFIVQKSYQDLHTVLDCKSWGTLWLDAATADDKLDFFITYSSITALVGNPGQAGYAYGNRFMDYFAEWREAQVAKGTRTGRSLSINWPLWASGGMGVNPAVEKALKDALGMVPMCTEYGLKAFVDGFQSPRPGFLAIEGDRDDITTKLDALPVDDLPPAMPAPVVVPPPHTPVVVAPSVAAVEARAERADLRQRAHDFLRQLIAAKFKVPLAKYDDDRSFEQYGIDSILITDLSNELEQHLGDLPKTLFFETANLTELLDYLLEDHRHKLNAKFGDAPAAAPAPVAAPNPVVVPAPVTFAVAPNPLRSRPAAQPMAAPAPVAAAPAPAALSDDQLRQKAREFLRELIAAQFKVPQAKYDDDRAFEQYGIDSVMILDLSAALEKHFGELSKTLFFEHQNLAELLDYFMEDHQDKLRQRFAVQAPAPVAAVPQPAAPQPAAPAPIPVAAVKAGGPAKPLAFGRNRFGGGVGKGPVAAPAPAPAARISRPAPGADVEIAIIGLAGRYPQAENVYELWDNLCQGRDCIEEIPEERWDWTRFYDPAKGKKCKTNSRWGGFITDYDKFDPLFFSISPKEAETLDPNERLFLEIAWATVEDAGYTRKQLWGSRTGVYAGVMWGLYQVHGAEAALAGPIHYPNSMYAAVANRVSYIFNFTGPSMVVDTMCSSSLTTLHLACESIRSGSCDQAIVGGVNLTLHPSKYLALATSNFTSSDGRCRAFGVGGDGYVPGEGVGALLVKRLDQALADDDQIYAVVKSTALNHGGKANGFTVPNPKAQGNLVAEALARIGWDPATLGYLEAHGTGTSLGDPIEINGLERGFAGSNIAKKSCPIGSVKSNIGHLESASGVVAITKVVLQMRYDKLVPSIHSKELNPNIDFENASFTVQRELGSWPQRDNPKRAGINSFGAGGANSHILLEEYPRQRPLVTLSRGLFVLSAVNAERLAVYAARMLDFFKNHDYNDLDFADVVYTSQVGRETLNHRLAIPAADKAQLMDHLHQVVMGHMEGNGRWVGALEGDHPDVPHIDAAELDRHYADADLDRLAQLWTSGVDLDWSRLYPAGRPHRVSLPTYPFRRDRYWIRGAQAPTSLSAAARLHPLVERNTCTLRQQRFTTHLTGTEFYVADHIIGGKPLVPGVAYLEMARAAGAYAAECPVTRVQHLAWTRPTIVDADKGARLEVVFTPRPEGVDFTVSNDQGRDCASGRLIFDQIAVRGGRLDLDQLRARLTQVRTPETCYADFAALGFGYGPKMRGIIEARTAPGEVLAHIRLPRAVAGEEGFLLHPTLLDSCLHSGLMLSQAGGPMLVPHGIETLTLHGEPGSEVVVYGRETFAEAKEKHLEFAVCDLEGNLLVHIEKFVARAMEATPTQAARAVERPAVPAGADAGLSAEGFLVDLIAARFGINASDFDPKSNFEKYGIDSVIIGEITADLSKYFQDLPDTLLFECKSVVELLEYLREEHAAQLDAMFQPGAPAAQSGGATDPNAARDGLTQFLRAMFAEEFALNPADLDPKAAFENYGIDSVMIGNLTTQLSKHFEGVPETLLFECKTLNELVDYFTEDHADRVLALFGAVATPASATDPDAVRGALSQFLRGILAEEFVLNPADLDPKAAFENYGIDSVMIGNLTTQLGKHFDDLPDTLLFECKTLNELTDYFLEDHAERVNTRFGATQQAAVAQDQVTVEAGPAPKTYDYNALRMGGGAARPKDIAVIGLGGRYPDCDNLHDFWTQLLKGTDFIKTVPADRWDMDAYFDTDKRKKNKSYAKWGSFLTDIDKFDPAFFNVSFLEAEIMPPEERFFLETAWTAMEDGGYARMDQPGRPIGVFVGLMWSDYAMLAAEHLFATGRGLGSSSHASVANRVSFCLNLNGPCMAVDTMCSSSLTTIHLACEAIRNGECEMALAGGANFSIHPYKFVGLSQRKFLAVDGRCRTFGEGGDGYVPGEGVGALLLKPLEAAEADGDHIYGVVRATVLNHGGKTNGFSVPDPVAQGKLIVAAYQTAGFGPETVGYVEAHGTGTALGDPIEISGLMRAFKKGMAKRDGAYCAIGSVKANIGHMEGAAGVVGVTKVLLQMKHRTIVPSIHSSTLNPKLKLEKTPFRVPQKAEPWRPLLDENGEALPLRAGVSGFGAGGSNAHVLLEAYQPQPEPAMGQGPFLFLLSARDEERLKSFARRFVHFLQDDDQAGDVAPAALAWTLQNARQHHAQRLALTFNDRLSLVVALENFLAGKSADAVVGKVEGLEKEHPQADQWLAAANLNALAQAWVTGARINWSGLYAGRTPRRVPLPTYPFARKRFWPGKTFLAQAGAAAPVAAAPKGGPVLHPLLHRNVSNFQEQAFETTLQGDGYYMVDHCVNANPMLPGAAYVEMARAAAQIAVGAPVTRIREVVWVQPVTGDGRNDRLLKLIVKPEGNRVAFQALTPGGAKPVQHCRAKLELGPANPPAAVDLSAVRARCPQLMSAAECYAKLAGSGLEYGPSFRTIGEIRSNDREALATLSLPAHLAADHDDYVIHPAILDGALQCAAGLLSATAQGATLLPFALEQVDVLATLPKQLHAYVTMNPASTADIKKLDIQLTDAAGATVMALRGFSVRALSGATAKPAVAAKPVVSQPTAPALQGDPVYYFTGTWRDLPAVTAPAAPASLLLFSDDAQAAGHYNTPVIRVARAAQFAATADGYSLNPGDEAHMAQLVDALLAKGDWPEAVVFDWSRTAMAQSLAQLNQDLDCGFYAVFHLTRALMEKRRRGKVQLIFITRRNGAETVPQFAGLSGLLRTVRLENPNYLYKILEVDAASQGRALTDLVLAELSDTQEREVRYQAGKRQRLKYVQFHQPAVGAQTLPVKDGGVYLITGGLGALGLLFARFIAQRCKANLVLTGRSALNAAKQAEVDQLKALGAQVLYVPADVADAAAADHLMAQIRATFGQLNGIIHSAGVVKDGYLKRKQPAEAATVLGPKLQGTFNLDRISADQPTDFMVLFSSLACLNGNVGQSDYAFGNRFMDHFAAWRQARAAQGQRRGRTLSINWPLWAEGGMQIDPAILKTIEKNMGMTPLTNPNGLAAFEAGFATDAHHFLAIQGREAGLVQFLEAEPLTTPRPVAPVAPKAIASGASASRDAVVARLTQVVSAEFNIPADEFDPEEAFDSYGMDSVIVMNIIGNLEEDFGDLSKTLFFEYQNLNQLADYFLEHHAQTLGTLLGAGPTPQAAAPAQPVTTGGDVLAYLTGVVSKEFNIPADEFDPEEAFDSYGMDSVIVMNIIGALEEEFGDLSKTLFFEYQNLNQLAGYFSAEHAHTLTRLLGAVPTQAAAPTVAAPAVATAPAPVATGGTTKATLDFLTQIVAAEFNIPGDEFDPEEPFDAYGMDSVIVMNIIGVLEEHFGDLSKTLFFEYQNLNQLAGYFSAEHADTLTRMFGAAAPAPPQVTAAPTAAGGDLTKAAVIYLTQIVSTEFNIPADEFDPEEAFDSYGMDSVIVMNIISALEDTFGDLSKTLFFEYQNLNQLAAYFVAEHAGTLSRITSVAAAPAPVSPAPAPAAAPLLQTRFAQTPAPVAAPAEVIHARPVNRDIAIIGMSGRFPMAPDLDTFWANLSAGRDCIEEVPADRWDHTPYYADGEVPPGRTNSKWGGFVTDHDKFDAQFFNMSPKEAALCDPNERTFLETAWSTMEDAGYCRDRMAGTRTGVYVGLMWAQYELFGVDPAYYGNHRFTSSILARTANRVSFNLDLSGPSVAFDTMCSASITCLHYACEDIISGRVDMAFAGGANFTLHPNKYQALAQNNFTASDGRCRAFGAGGSGYVPGEVIAAVLLKPLDRAVTEGDPIRAVIKVTALNHGGKASGFTVPNPRSQSALISEALERGGIDPRTIGAIEAHGTGTPLGDPVEIEGLTRAFGGAKADKQFCSIGSVKSNIGHGEAAAGIAGLAKAVLMLQHKQLPPTIHTDTLNPNIKYQTTPFRVQRTLEPFPAFTDASGRPMPRRVGLSSFGAGGSNGHVILEEYVETRDLNSHATAPFLLVLSARNQDRLSAYAQRLHDFVQKTADLDPGRFCYTLQHGRDGHDERLALSFMHRGDLLTALKAVGAGQIPAGAHTANARKVRRETTKMMNSPAGKQRLADALAQRSLTELAALWVIGVTIPWAKLYDHQAPAVLSLPGYPFEPVRHWVDRIRPEFGPDFALDHHIPGSAPKPVYLQNTWRDAQPLNGRYKLQADEVMLVVDESDFGANALRYAAAGAGEVIQLKPGAAFRQLGPYLYEVDTVDHQHYQIIADQLAAAGKTPVAVVFLREADPSPYPATVALANGALDWELIHGAYALFQLVKVLHHHGWSKTLTALYCINGNHSLGAAVHQASAGMAAALAAEAPGIRLRTVTFDPGLAGFGMEHLLNELADPQNPRAVRYAAGRRQISERGPIQVPTAQSAFKRGGNYILTGCDTDVGYRLAAWLVYQAGANVAVLGGEEQAWPTQLLAENGGRIVHFNTDLSHEQQLDQAVAQVRAQFGSIDGVLHAAARSEPAPLTHKDVFTFARVIEPKLYGVTALDVATRSDRLDFFLTFAATQAVAGLPGAADAGFAAAYLDHFAAQRAKRVAAGHAHGRSLAVTWSEAPSEDGIGPFDLTLATATLANALALDLDNVTILAQDDRVLHRLTGAADQAPATPVAAAKPAARAAAPAPVAVAAPVAQADPRQHISQLVRNVLGSVLGMNPAQIDPTEELESYGIDSVDAVKIANGIQKELKQDVSPNHLAEYPTVEELIDALAASQPAGSVPAPQAEPAAVQAAPAVQAAAPAPAAAPQAVAVQEAPAPAGQDPRKRVDRAVKTALGAVLQLNPEEIDPSESFETYGMDSVDAVKIANGIQKELKQDVSPNYLAEYPTIEELIDALVAEAE